MTVSFVIPHHRNLAMLQAAIRSVEALDLADGCLVEIVVVDNASTESAREWAIGAGYRVVPLETNLGFGAAVNRGIQASTGSHVVVMNDDVEFAPTWLLEIQTAIADSDQGWFACGKTLCFTDHERIDGAGDAICRGGVSWRIGNGCADGPAFDSGRPTYFPSATATLFRREFFEQVGMFDEIFFAYLEDVDLGLRAAGADCCGRYVPEAEAYHHGSSTGQAWSSAMVRWITAHQLMLLAKHYGSSTLIRQSWNILVAQVLWAALAIRRRRATAWVQGVALGLMQLRQARLRSSELRKSGDTLAGILAASESEIERYQGECGFDMYWKWYFRLVGRSRSAGE